MRAAAVLRALAIAGAFAFMALMYTLAERYLDMGEGDVHVFFNFPWIKQHHDHDHDGEEAHEAEALSELEPAAAVAVPDATGRPVHAAATLQGAES